jgi:hypothetical protein
VTSQALFGILGVLAGTLTTSLLTIYKDRLAARHDLSVRDQQYERDRQATRDAFQRESILELQSAVSDLVQAAYAELDRVLAEHRESGVWSARQWETPTAVGWSEALLRLEVSRARVFDSELRTLAEELRTFTYQSVWAGDLATAKELDQHIEPLLIRFNDAVNKIMPSLY